MSAAAAPASASASSAAAAAGPAPLEVDVRAEDARWEAFLGGDAEGACARALAPAAAALGVEGAVAVLLTGDAALHALNARWRGKDAPTDVLSFPHDGPAAPGEPRHLGDIALAYETVAGDAAALSREPLFHAAHLLVHGFLHLLGHDHLTPEDAARMEPLERSLLAAQGWPDPYGDDDQSHA